MLLTHRGSLYAGPIIVVGGETKLIISLAELYNVLHYLKYTIHKRYRAGVGLFAFLLALQ